MSRKRYFAVRWGDKLWDPPANLRTCHVEDAGKACRDTFGMVAENMYVKDLGTSVSVLRSDKRRIEALTTEAGYALVDVRFLDPMGLNARSRRLRGLATFTTEEVRA